MKRHVVSRKNQINSILFVLALMIITIAVLLRGYSIHKLIEVLKSVQPFFFITGIAMMVFYIFCQALTFKTIMEELNQPVSFRKSVDYSYIGYYFGSITPGASGGQPAQLYYMSKDGISLTVSSITIFIYVFVYQIVMILFSTVMALLRFDVASEFAERHWYLLIVGSIVTVGITVFIFALMFSRKLVPFLLSLIVKLGSKLHLIKKPEEMQDRIDQSMISYHEKSEILTKHPSLFFKVLLITIFQWTATCMVSYLVYLGLGYREHGVLELLTSQTLLNICLAAVPLPGSVGVAEDIFLKSFLRYYPSDMVPSAMILSRIINFYLPLVISFVVYLFAHIRIMKHAKHHEL
jgi:uncharacterized protein (TIRG00374 family)